MRPINGTWACKPGNFDPLNALDLQPSTNHWGIPTLQPVQLGDEPQTFIAYDDWRKLRNKKAKLPERSCVHFFMEDYRFETVWNQPERATNYLDGADVVLTPDFSLYRDHPLAIQLWNTYRNRWLGAYWQSKGKTVIPTVCWSDVRSFKFAFLGLPPRATLAVSTVGINADPVALRLFEAGYREMCDVLEPAQVLCYSERFPEQLTNIAPLRLFEPWQLSLRHIDFKKKMDALPTPDVAEQRKLTNS